MTESVTISKDQSSFPDYLDFQKLRAAGLEHIQNLGSDLWTDYNLHDPGITILEVLCYALTDLGFRTNFDTPDLFARSPEALAQDQARSTADGKLYDDNFFTAEQVLTCNPVTLLDLRKLLIDIPGVRNAWLQRASEAELAFYINKKKNRLQYTLPDFIDETNEAEVDEATVALKGLYTVCLETTTEPEIDACGRPYTPTGDILDEVCSVLHRHRNLCEDFLDVVVLADEEIGICTDIELTSEADPEDVLLGIYTAIQEFLSPTFQFYTLQEMLERGKSVEEIFEGRPLSPQSHGFIDIDELKKAELRETLHASDLYQEIMNVPGVLAIRKFIFANSINDLPQTLGEAWCLKLTPKHRPLLDLDKSKFTFYKGLLPFNPSEAAVIRRYEEEKAASTKALLETDQLDLPVPEGTYRDVEDYYSIQHDFPEVYGVGEVGLRQSETAERKAQARQLKAYLLFFDQILANYLAQLANVRELFSMRPDEDRPAGKNRTYFTQLLEGVPRVEELLLNFNDCPGDEGYLDVPVDYPEYLGFIAESIETYHDRRNRFLDHLMARFAESFTDYVLMMYTINGKRHDNARIIQDKTDFLGSYPEISRNRGKAFDYKAQPVWDTENVSGLQKRVFKLVGIDDVRRRDLSHCDVVEVAAAWHFVLTVPDDHPERPFRLESKQGFATEAEAQAAYAAFLALAEKEANYQRLAYNGGRATYGFIIVDAAGVCVVESPTRFDTPDERDIHLFNVINYASGSGMACEVFQTTACYFYEVYDATGEVLLLVAEQGEPTAAASLEAYQTGFLPAARDGAFYRDIDAPGAFGFEVMTEPGGDTRLARHPHTYATAQERNDRKQAVIYYLDEEEPTFGTDGPPGEWTFEVRDNAGTLLFVNSEIYPTEAAALDAYREVVRQAPFRVHYRMLNAIEGDAPFGFELLDRHDNRIASHPTAYETDIARDLALDAIILLLFDDDDVRFEIVESESDGRFTFELLNLEGRLLLASAESFETEAEAQTAFQAFLPHAADSDRYTLIDDIAGDNPFGFSLNDASDNPLATHPTAYATEAERNLALQAVINYVSPAELEFEVSGHVGILHFVLVGEEGRVLFKSIATYPDVEEARAAFDAFLMPARDAQRYHLLPGFGFELRDEDDQIVAEHPQTYASDIEREAAIAMILAYVRDDDVIFDVVNTQGAYFFDVQDEDGVSWLIGAETMPGLPEGAAACSAALDLAADIDNYRRLDAGPGNCPYGFELLDETAALVARHPGGYTSADERDAAIRHLIATVLDGDTIPDVVQPDGAEFGFELVAPGGQVLFTSTTTWATEAEARAAMKRSANLANYRVDYDNTACLHTFSLVDGGAVIATHPLSYSTRRALDKAVDAIIYLVATQDLACVIHGTDCGHYFRLAGEAGTAGEDCVFVSSARFPDAARASSACNRVAPLLSDAAHYAVVADDDGTFHLVVQDADGVEQAVYQGPEDDEAALNAVVTKTIDYVTEARDLAHELAERESGFRFQLEGPEGEVLFTSTTLFTSDEEAVVASEDAPDAEAMVEGEVLSLDEDTAEDRAWTACNLFSELVQEREYFRLITDPINCLYGFELMNRSGRTIAEHHPFYPTAAARDDAMAYIGDWVNDEGLHLVEHLLLRPKNSGITPTYYFELIHDATDVPLFRSVEVYIDEDSAIAELKRLLALLITGDAGVLEIYSQAAEGQSCFSFRLVDGGEVLAEHEIVYPSEQAAEAAFDALVAYVRALFEEALDTDENVYGDAENLNVAVDRLLHASLTDADLAPYVDTLTVAQDLEADAFLPLDECCVDDEGEICSLRSDPYSFRATVVLPYWPRRFRNVAFRNFFERTIRAETPAHIFLRICWVDVCDMREFEEAYQRWLHAQAATDGDCADAEENCDATAALNRLTELLVRLRNIYPEAILRPCEDSTDGPPIILNQTLLGSATVESDDNG